MVNITDYLKKGDYSQKKIYSKYTENQIGNSLSYKKFKRKNIELLEFKKYIEDMNNFDYLTKGEINNIFRYLSKNLKSSKYNDIKEIVTILKDIRKIILDKMKNLQENEKNICECLTYILSQIEILNDLIANKINLEYDSLNKTIAFENLIRKIISKENMDNIGYVFVLVYDNVELLNFHDHKNRSFSNLLCDAILNAKLNNHIELFNYYKEIVNFILNIKGLNLDAKKLLNALDINEVEVEYGHALDDKIFNLKFDSKTGRYLLKDDYIISIDSDGTNKIDDALSIEKTAYGSYILGIHISDVYSLGIFANEMLKDKNSIDCVNKVKASLDEYRKRNTISLFIEISKSGIPKDYRLLKTRLEVDKNLLNEDVAKILCDKQVKPELSETIRNLADLYNIVENNKFPKYPSVKNMGDLIIKKYMLLYGCIISTLFSKNNVPAIYLNGEDKMFSVEEKNYDAGFSEYNTYSKATAPIYDKVSLINQYILHHCIFESASSLEKIKLQYILTPIVDDLNKKRS